MITLDQQPCQLRAKGCTSLATHTVSHNGVPHVVCEPCKRSLKLRPHQGICGICGNQPHDCIHTREERAAAVVDKAIQIQQLREMRL